MDFFYILLGAVVGFYVGWVINEKYTIYRAKLLLNKAHEYMKQEDEYIKNHSLHLRMEKTEHTYFFYNKNDGSFIYSAPNKTELLEYLNRKYPDMYIYLDTKDLKELEKA